MLILVQNWANLSHSVNREESAIRISEGTDAGSFPNWLCGRPAEVIAHGSILAYRSLLPVTGCGSLRGAAELGRYPFICGLLNHSLPTGAAFSATLDWSIEASSQLETEKTPAARAHPCRSSRNFWPKILVRR